MSVFNCTVFEIASYSIVESRIFSDPRLFILRSLSPFGMTLLEFRQNIWYQKTGVLTSYHRLRCGVVCVIVSLAVLIQQNTWRRVRSHRMADALRRVARAPFRYMLRNLCTSLTTASVNLVIRKTGGHSDIDLSDFFDKNGNQKELKGVLKLNLNYKLKSEGRATLLPLSLLYY